MIFHVSNQICDTFQFHYSYPQQAKVQSYFICLSLIKTICVYLYSFGSKGVTHLNRNLSKNNFLPGNTALDTNFYI